jgi:hypothetical protein
LSLLRFDLDRSRLDRPLPRECRRDRVTASSASRRCPDGDEQLITKLLLIIIDMLAAVIRLISFITESFVTIVAEGGLQPTNLIGFKDVATENFEFMMDLMTPKQLIVKIFVKRSGDQTGRLGQGFLLR